MTNQLCTSDSIIHVKADIHLYFSGAISQLYNRDLKSDVSFKLLPHISHLKFNLNYLLKVTHITQSNMKNYIPMPCQELSMSFCQQYPFPTELFQVFVEEVHPIFLAQQGQYH